MDHVLGDAGRAFLKAFLAALLVVGIGMSQQPDLNGAVAVGIAGLMGAIAAGLAAVQVFVPELSFRAHVPEPFGSLLDAFAHAFIAAFLTAAIGWLAEPNLATWKAAVIGALVGAINAGLRALQGLTTKGEHPAPKAGITGRRPAAGRTLAPA